VNKELYDKTIELPEEVVTYLGQCMDTVGDVPETTQGYKRNKDLRDNGTINYQQLKRIKNWFDSFQGAQNDIEYILHGADYVKNWVNQTLDTWRDDVKVGKEVKSTVLPNQFIKTHAKDGLNTQNRPSASHKTTKDYYDLNVTESIDRINDLIKKVI